MSFQLLLHAYFQERWRKVSVTAMPHDRKLRVLTEEGQFLFAFVKETQSIEIRHEGQDYAIPMWLIQEHLRTSQRDTLRVYQSYEDNDEDHRMLLPCGHRAGTVMDAYMNKICSICGQ